MEKKIKKILILEGGYNEEHEVSLKTSREVKKILDFKNFKYKTLIVNPLSFKKDISKFKNYICFNALHGPFGEDGQIQKILKKNKLKFTHSNIKSSQLCFNKLKTKEIIIKNKILTPKFKILNTVSIDINELKKIKKRFGKFVIKPIKSGSSFGIKIIKNNKDLLNLSNDLLRFKKNLINHKFMLVEEYIAGKELTVSTIKIKNKVKALAVTEIKFKNSFFDYKSKYTKGYSNHILPAKLSNHNYNFCLDLAIKVHKILGCNSITRTDFILGKKNKIYFLETNTQPGLTRLSLLPEQALYKKISFEKIILETIKQLN